MKRISESQGQRVTPELLSTSAGYVRLLAPSGGEVFFTGSTYEIDWEATSDAATFTLMYSTDNGVKWIPILDATDLTGDNYLWTVPPLTGNKKACRIKVTGYNAAAFKVEEDISDAPFTIEVIQVTSPKADDPLTSGDIWEITWTTHETKEPVALVMLHYSKDGGAKWIPIPANITEDLGTYPWTVPGVKGIKKKCKVKVVLQDEAGKPLSSDMSDGFFTITASP